MTLAEFEIAVTAGAVAGLIVGLFALGLRANCVCPSCHKKGDWIDP